MIKFTNVVGAQSQKEDAFPAAVYPEVEFISLRTTQMIQFTVYSLIKIFDQLLKINNNDFYIIGDENHLHQICPFILLRSLLLFYYVINI